MKKLFFAFAVIAITGSMSSCKKNWTCTCSSTTNGITVSASTTINDTKSNATSTCSKGSTTAGGITVTCAIQ